jgi:aminopeptidase-like protein
MNDNGTIEFVNTVEVGRQMHAFAHDLYPICRSITGDGIRKTLEIVGRRIPLQQFEVPSGTEVFDWVVPKEWNIRDAYIADAGGARLVELHNSNLHVVSYSIPVHRKMSFDELKPHLFTMPEHPTWIPYRTSYYKEDWGFCLSHNQLLQMDEQAEYEVRIDSSLESGSLTYGECFLPGQSSEEVLISCHACHPSLANDNLSGLAVATFLAECLAERELYYSYRFVFIPGTIGAITWLSRNREAADRIQHGLVLTCLGDADGFHYKKSRRGNADIDRAVAIALTDQSEPAEIMDFSPYGYDERQYCSPGFNLPVGCLMRSVWGTFPEYHTSADNLEFLQPKKLGESLRLCLRIFDVLDKNRRYRNLNPYCEPQLGKRDLYCSTGGGQSIAQEIHARLWVLNLSDGQHSLLDIAERSGMSFSLIRDAAELLQAADLLAVVDDATVSRPKRSRHGMHARPLTIF